jgi:ABC-type Zn uptake system ZnuABC Zn-binding protein ZnuA
VLLNQGRNAVVQPGQIGHLDASRSVRALGVPSASIDRSAGDVHLAGNPHYLLDPLCGLQVATALRDRFVSLWPGQRERFVANHRKLQQQLAAAMVGEKLAALYDHDAEKLALAYGNGTLLEVLREQGDLSALGGWFQALQPHRGAAVVVDHDLWPYFAERAGLSVFGFLEPRPGMTPTSAHLAALTERMREAKVKVVLTAAYFPPQYAKLVTDAVGGVIAPMAHQPGAQPGTDDYVAFVDYNVRTLVAALGSATTRQ